MSNKRIIKILEALSKAADVDLGFTDEDAELEDNFDGVKDGAKKDMPKEKFDKAGGPGTPKKMNTDPKIDKVTDSGVKGGAQQKDSKSLKKEAYLIKMIQEMSGKKVKLVEAADVELDEAPEVGNTYPDVLKKRQAFDTKTTKWTKDQLLAAKAKYEAKLSNQYSENGRMDPADAKNANFMVSQIDNYIKKMDQEPAKGMTDYVSDEDQISEASRAERITKGKGTGNLKV